MAIYHLYSTHIQPDSGRYLIYVKNAKSVGRIRPDLIRKGQFIIDKIDGDIYERNALGLNARDIFL